jgi:CheY-like chemotaxis protein
MGGSISVDSELGRGSTFRVVLPSVTGIPRERPGQPHPQPAPAARKGRVLIIDDEAQIGSALARALRAHDVVTLTMASEGLARIRSGERFDVIFCDLMMPQMTGMDFYAVLEKEEPEQARRIVFLTGGAFTSAAREFLEAVVNPRMEKPFDLQNVRALLAERLRALE